MKAINALILAVLMSVSVSVATVVDGSAEAERRTDTLSRMANCTIAPENDEVEPERDDVDEDYILRVITAEGGTDQLVCNGVAQCLYNACERDLWAHSVEYVIEEYQYTTPAEWVSDEARIAWDAVFCSGVTFVDFGDALYFYAPAYCDSPWHESQRFVAEVSGVRFFEEAG